MYKTITHFSTYIVPTLCREILLSLDKSRVLYSRKMKLLAVVFCTGLLSISAAAVSDNLFGLSLQPSAQAVSSSLPYSRHKRQVEDFDQLRRCQGIINDQQCNYLVELLLLSLVAQLDQNSELRKSCLGTAIPARLPLKRLLTQQPPTSLKSSSACVHPSVQVMLELRCTQFVFVYLTD